ncbi:MAG: TolC family protein [Candidatus Margulisiibacteriota bacterium]
MKNKHIISLAAALSVFFICAASHAETWSEVVALAKKNNNELKSAEKNLEAYEWSYKKSLTSFLPQLSASAAIGGTDTASFSAKSSSYGLSATQSLFSGFGNINAARSAYAQMESARANLTQKTSGILYDVRAAFLDLLIAEKDLALQEQILVRRTQNSKLITLLYESGKEDRGNLMLTLADVESSNTAVSQAKRNLELARLKLSQLTGTQITKTDGTSLETNTPGNVDINMLSTTSPSYAIAKYTFDIASISADQVLAELLPSVSLSGNIRKSGSDWPPQTDSRSWALNLSYSFFPGGGNIADKVIKEIQKEQARQTFEQSKKDVLYSIKSAYDNFANKLEGLNVSGFYVNASTERAKIARTKYVNGLMSYNDWNTIENSFISAERAYLSAQKDTFVAEAAWHNSYGGWIK